LLKLVILGEKLEIFKKDFSGLSSVIFPFLVFKKEIGIPRDEVILLVGSESIKQR
jgi:hypothetical protein